MTVNSERPLLFLDVDGPLIPFGSDHGYPDNFLTHEMRPDPWWVAENPMLVRLDPGIGARLLALGCDLVWATAWMSDANELIGPLIGLPELPVVALPDRDGDEGEGEDADEKGGGEDDESVDLHWKTRFLVEWAAGRPFIWVDDEITGADRDWVVAHHHGRALLHRVDHLCGLTDADFATLDEWLLAGLE